MTDYIDKAVAMRKLVDLPAELDAVAVQRCIEAIHSVPAADVVKVVRCKDCKHRPYSTEPGKTYGLTIEAPDGRCPCYNEDDGWYSWVPDNEFFCFYGERKEGKA